MKRARLLSVATIACAWVHAADAGARLFVIDGYNASLTFSCEVMGMVPIKGAFTRFLAVIALDELAPGEARAVVRVDASSMSLSESGLIDKLKGPDFFDIAKYPEFGFDSYGAKVIEPGLLRLDGSLTVRGVTQPFSLRVRYVIASDGVASATTIEADGELDRTAFGMTAYDVILSDDVSIAVDGLMNRGIRPIVPGG